MKLENIAFWILIALIIAVALWMLHGSPTDSSAIIAVGLFVASSEILLWKTLFSIDKKTSIEFEKLDKKTAISFEKTKSRFDKIDDKLNKIENLIKK